LEWLSCRRIVTPNSVGRKRGKAWPCPCEVEMPGIEPGSEEFERKYLQA
jgi:hypothetical protein